VTEAFSKVLGLERIGEQELSSFLEHTALRSGRSPFVSFSELLQWCKVRDVARLPCRLCTTGGRELGDSLLLKPARAPDVHTPMHARMYRSVRQRSIAAQDTPVVTKYIDFLLDLGAVQSSLGVKETVIDTFVLVANSASTAPDDGELEVEAQVAAVPVSALWSHDVISMCTDRLALSLPALSAGDHCLCALEVRVGPLCVGFTFTHMGADRTPDDVCQVHLCAHICVCKYDCFAWNLLGGCISVLVRMPPT
jgi:hypothetical protein